MSHVAHSGGTASIAALYRRPLPLPWLSLAGTSRVKTCLKTYLRDLVIFT